MDVRYVLYVIKYEIQGLSWTNKYIIIKKCKQSATKNSSIP